MESNSSKANYFTSLPDDTPEDHELLAAARDSDFWIGEMSDCGVSRADSFKLTTLTLLCEGGAEPHPPDIFPGFRYFYLEPGDGSFCAFPKPDSRRAISPAFRVSGPNKGKQACWWFLIFLDDLELVLRTLREAGKEIIPGLREWVVLPLVFDKDDVVSEDPETPC